MGKKYVVRLTEQELADFISSQIMKSGGENFVGELIKNLLSGDKQVSKTDGKSPVVSGGDSKFITLDLNTPEGYNAYKNIADSFISSRSSNLLNITGSMMADAAKNAFNKFGKYVPAELALAQLAAEGGFADNPNARPIRTKNPFNVGNVDTGKNIYHGSVQSGIQSYYDLIAKRYLTGSKTPSDLLNNFVNSSGQRYATEPNYESSVKKLVNSVSQRAQPIYASLTKKSDTKSV